MSKLIEFDNINIKPKKFHIKIDWHRVGSILYNTGFPLFFIGMPLIMIGSLLMAFNEPQKV